MKNERQRIVKVKGDYSMSTTKTYRQPTEASLKKLSKSGVKVVAKKPAIRISKK